MMNEKTESVGALANLDDVRAWIDECGAQAGGDEALEKIDEARAAIDELIEAARAAEFHLTREHRAPMTVDAADYLTEVERDRNRIRAALAGVGGGK